MKEYDRITQWGAFDEQVRAHILRYTLQQYGNPGGDEQVDGFTVEDCWKNIERYANRRRASVRGDVERLRDLIKVAHYAQLAYDKLKKEVGQGDIYE